MHCQKRAEPNWSKKALPDIERIQVQSHNADTTAKAKEAEAVICIVQIEFHCAKTNTTVSEGAWFYRRSPFPIAKSLDPFA